MPVRTGGTPTLPFNLPVPPPSWAQLPPGISLCMIVRNEERFLGACLESVRGVVDEINVLDTGSTDATLEIAARFGARIGERAWRDDFAWARNEALAMATRRWILILDADERLVPETAAALRALGRVPAHLTGLWVRCKNLVDDFKGTGTVTNALVRVFPNHPRLRFRNPIHEFVTLDGSPYGTTAVPTELEIEHRGYLSEVMESRGKAQRNLAMSRRGLDAAPEDPYQWFNFASSAVLAGDVDTAIDALERVRSMLAGETRGFKPGALALLAELYCERRGEYAHAITIAREALAATPTLGNAHFTVGKALVKLGRHAEAREAFGAAIGAGAHARQHFTVDDEIAAWKSQSEIGLTFIAEGRPDEALAWFERGLRNRPQAQPLRLNRARVLEELGRPDEAEEAYRTVALEDRDDLASIEYVNFLLRRGRIPEALAALEASLHCVSPTAAATMLGSAACLAFREGDVLTARRYVVRAQAAAARGVHPDFSLADLFVRLGEPRALALLRHGTEPAPAGRAAGLALAQGILGTPAQPSA